MNPTPLRQGSLALLVVFLAPFLISAASAQTCQTSADMDAAARTAITNAGQRYFGMASKSDAASLKQNSIPSLASDFGGVENLIKERQPDLAGAQAVIKNAFLLDNEQGTQSGREEFYCGVFGKNGQTANSAAFYLDNLPPAKYAVVLMDATRPKGRTSCRTRQRLVSNSSPPVQSQRSNAQRVVLLSASAQPDFTAALHEHTGDGQVL